MLALATVAAAGFPGIARAADEYTTESIFGAFGFFWLVGVAGAVLALYKAWEFYKWMESQSPGTPRMVEIAGYVRTGADAYLRQQYKVVAAIFVVIFLLLAVMAFALKVQSAWVPFAFISGGFFSGLAGWFGMKTATLASNRTAAGAERSLNEGLQVAFRSGAVMGLTVVGLGLLDIMLWFLILYWLVPIFATPLSLEEITVTMLCFGMGASAQALFARVGGGIFTKAADVGADLVGKVEHGIPEDDARNPATIADNVGDNVGDVAGMGADLYESYCGSILATAALGVAAFHGVPRMQLAALFLPMSIAAAGIVLSIWGIYQVRTKEDSSQKTLLAALARGINMSTIAVVGAAIVLTWMLLGGSYMGVALAVIVGLVAGEWVKLADQLAVQVGDTRKANTLWMVLDKEVLTGRTDAEGKVLREPVIAGLDARGRRQVTEVVPDMAVVKELQDDNRIVAVKTARMADYMRYYDVTLMNPKVLVGLFIGAMSTFVFCALTMKAVGRAAKGMVEEVRRQFREKPGIMEGTDTPDYAAPVEISTKAAQREMVLPSLLALSLPIIVGLVLGVSGVMGLLVGGLTTGFCVAVFMANAGGAWDNAKKHIEGGAHGGKGTDAHKAAVVGDTVGDPFKDTSGPSLNILVKLMSMVSVVAAGLIVRYSLEALGIF